jgi:hypothetical protein
LDKIEYIELAGKIEERHAIPAERKEDNDVIAGYQRRDSNYQMSLAAVRGGYGQPYSQVTLDKVKLLTQTIPYVVYHGRMKTSSSCSNLSTTQSMERKSSLASMSSTSSFNIDTKTNKRNAGIDKGEIRGTKQETKLGDVGQKIATNRGRKNECPSGRGKKTSDVKTSNVDGLQKSNQQKDIVDGEHKKVGPRRRAGSMVDISRRLTSSDDGRPGSAEGSRRTRGPTREIQTKKRSRSSSQTGCRAIFTEWNVITTRTTMLETVVPPQSISPCPPLDVSSQTDDAFFAQHTPLSSPEYCTPASTPPPQDHVDRSRTLSVEAFTQTASPPLSPVFDVSSPSLKLNNSEPILSGREIIVPKTAAIVEALKFVSISKAELGWRVEKPRKPERKDLPIVDVTVYEYGELLSFFYTEALIHREIHVRTTRGREKLHSWKSGY